MPQTFAPLAPGGQDALLRELCDLARTLTDARTVALILTDPSLAALAPVLGAGGLICRVAQDDQPRATPGPYRLAAQREQVSDVVSLGLPLIGAEGPVGRLELDGARPDALGQRAAAGLTQVAALIAGALGVRQAGRDDLPQRMLALVEAVTDHDDAAASRLLTGLLRLASGGAPSMVEVTALRIAGLAALEGTRISLTPEGRTVLAQGGVAPQVAAALSVPLPQAAMRGLQAPPPRARPDWKPFARLAIADSAYVIGEAGEYDPLAYRPEGTPDAPWRELRNGLVDGWTEIATEILAGTHDILHEYARMHMIRRRDIDLEEVAEVYDLHGLSWTVRRIPDGAEARIGSGPWQALTRQPGCSDEPGVMQARETAICALTQLWPDLSERIGHDVRSWARRMAMGATVAPIAGPVAA